jgi:hypothetical protein
MITEVEVLQVYSLRPPRLCGEFFCGYAAPGDLGFGGAQRGRWGSSCPVWKIEQGLPAPASPPLSRKVGQQVLDFVRALLQDTVIRAIRDVPQGARLAHHFELGSQPESLRKSGNIGILLGNQKQAGLTC